MGAQNSGALNETSSDDHDIVLLELYIWYKTEDKGIHVSKYLTSRMLAFLDPKKQETFLRFSVVSIFVMALAWKGSHGQMGTI